MIVRPFCFTNILLIDALQSSVSADEASTSAAEPSELIENPVATETTRIAYIVDDSDSEYETDSSDEELESHDTGSQRLTPTYNTCKHLMLNVSFIY